jgi:transcriptional repressor NrdR
VPTALVDEAIARICHRLLQLGEREVPSRQIGEMVMETLKEVDAVAYVRFASVYRNFREAKDFGEFVGRIAAAGD